ncbi:hypothetical protein ACFXPT_11715 [Streptomyces goshikiensis]|uniref:hypothetical protein n=1 Tax=Streptomyces goshikiensis TaxID=1942 RepID=UPI0036C7F479
MRLPGFLYQPEPSIDMTTPEARAEYAELLHRQEAENAPPPRVVDFGRPQPPPPGTGRWFEEPPLAMYRVVRASPGRKG